MMTFKRVVFLFLVLSLNGCETFRYEQAKPALLENNIEAVAEIEKIISATLHVKNINLSQNIFQKEHWLAIDKVGVRNINNGLLLGRLSDRPNSFQLLIFNQHCFLYQLSSQSFWKLKQAQCKPVDY